MNECENLVIVVHVQDIEQLNQAVADGYEIKCATAGYVVLEKQPYSGQYIPIL